MHNRQRMKSFKHAAPPKVGTVAEKDRHAYLLSRVSSVGDEGVN